MKPMTIGMLGLGLCAITLLGLGAVISSGGSEWFFLAAVPAVVLAFTMSRIFRVRRLDEVVDRIVDDDARHHIERSMRRNLVVWRALEVLLTLCGLTLVLVADGFFRIGAAVGVVALACAIVVLEHNTRVFFAKATDHPLGSGE